MQKRQVRDDANILGSARKEIVFTHKPLGFQIGPDEDTNLAVVTQLEKQEARELGVWVGAKVRAVDGQDFSENGSYSEISKLLVNRTVSSDSPLTIVFGDIFEKGDEVLGNKRGEGIWFRGTIINVRDNGTYDIKYPGRNGQRQFTEMTVPVHHIVKRPPKQNKPGQRPTSRYGRNLEYKLDRKIGSGSFGQVYLGRDVLTDDAVAIKFEDQRAGVPQLYEEFKIMHKCMDKGMEGMPRGLWCEDMSKFKVLVMDLLGPSLEDLFNFCGRQFNLKTTLMLADQMVSRLQNFHEVGFIHRDIKTDNFCMGLRKGALRVVNLIDFGLSKQYMYKGQHIPYKTGKSLTGTPRYASVNVHKGREPSRRDDLESCGYLFLYFLKGKLPWQGQQAQSREAKYKKIMNLKISKLKDVCNGLPDCFLRYSEYCRKLEFEDKPNYKLLKKFLADTFQETRDERTGDYLVLDHKYDWVRKLENKEYRQEDLKVPTLARFKSEERKHAEQIGKMLASGDLDEDKPEEMERKIAEMEGITAEILGELDAEGDDGQDKMALMYRAVTDRSQRYRAASGFHKDGDSVKKVRESGGRLGGKDMPAGDNANSGGGCGCTIL